MAWRLAIAATAVFVALGTLALSGKLPVSGHTYATQAQARRVALEFFRSQNDRRYEVTCRLLSVGFIRTHALRDRQTCTGVMRVVFVWSGRIDFRIGDVTRTADRVIVHGLADGASGRLVLVREDGALRILAVEDD